MSGLSVSSPFLSRPQHRQFVPHGRRPGPSHGVAGQRDDGRAERRTARGPALLTPPPPPPPSPLPSPPHLSHAFLVKTTGSEKKKKTNKNTVYKENIIYNVYFCEGLSDDELREKQKPTRKTLQLVDLSSFLKKREKRRPEVVLLLLLLLLTEAGF